jgi:hypothetical protein
MSNATWSAIITAGVLVAAIALAVLVIVLVRRRLVVGAGSGSAVERVLAAQGPTRCVEAIALLRAVTGRAGAEDLTELWFRIEAPLREVLPGCPPPLTALLAQALEECAASCRQRAVAKAMTGLRETLPR